MWELRPFSSSGRSRSWRPWGCSKDEAAAVEFLAMTWFNRLSKQPSAGAFGPLEWRVLEALWERNDPGSVRDLQPAFAEIAYTTLMTTLDRLHRKGVLDRIKRGRAFFYTAR